LRYLDRNTWFWLLLGALFFLPFLGGVHLFDWDEINFAELAREMVVSGDWLNLQINYETFTEKPPMFFWLQAAAMELFGVGEYAARFPNALLGMLVLPFLYISGKFLIDRTFGFLWALSWFGSILPFLYFKSGIIDPYFNFFIFNGIFFLIHYAWKKNSYRDLYFSRSASAYLWLAGISIGLAILVKGPVAYLILALTLGVYWVFSRFKRVVRLWDFVKLSLVALAVFLLWFAVDLMINGPDFLIEFTIRQWELLVNNDAGHGGFPGYHVVVLLFGCFPASIFAIRAIAPIRGLPFHIRDFRKWMVVLLMVVLVLFSLVNTKIIHYSSLAYYPLSFLSALTIWNLSRSKLPVKLWMKLTVLLIGLIVVFVSLALPWAGMHPEEIAPLFEKDPFARANLQAEVNWSQWDYLPGIFMAIVILTFFLSSFRSVKISSRILFFGTGIWTMLALVFFIAKVERISQYAAVEFFEAQQNKEVYVTTYNYKSYVPWFYARVQPYENEKANEKHWLYYGDTDLPVMISTKITSREKLESDIKDAELLYEKNGFVFYRRPASN